MGLVDKYGVCTLSGLNSNISRWGKGGKQKVWGENNKATWRGEKHLCLLQKKKQRGGGGGGRGPLWATLDGSKEVCRTGTRAKGGKKRKILSKEKRHSK